MPYRSDFRNNCQAPSVPFFVRDGFSGSSYNRNMARSIEFDWHLNDWILAVGLDPADFRKQAGWSKRKMSELVNGQMRYNKHVINEAAAVLNIRPFELLLPPDEAMEIRSLRRALLLVAESRNEFRSEPAQLSQPFERGSKLG